MVTGFRCRSSIDEAVPQARVGARRQDMDGPRACLPSDDVEIVDLINKLFREGTGQDVRTDYPLLYDPDRLAYRRVIKMNG